MEDENQGSLLLGVALGFFLGCLGVLISAFVIKGSKTTTGSIVGTILQLLMFGCVGGGLAVLQFFLLQG